MPVDDIKTKNATWFEGENPKWMQIAEKMPPTFKINKKNTYLPDDLTHDQAKVLLQALTIAINRRYELFVDFVFPQLAEHSIAMQKEIYKVFKRNYESLPPERIQSTREQTLVRVMQKLESLESPDTLLSQEEVREIFEAIQKTASIEDEELQVEAFNRVFKEESSSSTMASDVEIAWDKVMYNGRDLLMQAAYSGNRGWFQLMLDHGFLKMEMKNHQFNRSILLQCLEHKNDKFLLWLTLKYRKILTSFDTYFALFKAMACENDTVGLVLYRELLFKKKLFGTYDDGKVLKVFFTKMGRESDWSGASQIFLSAMSLCYQNLKRAYQAGELEEHVAPFLFGPWRVSLRPEPKIEENDRGAPFSTQGCKQLEDRILALLTESFSVVSYDEKVPEEPLLALPRALVETSI